MLMVGEGIRKGEEDVNDAMRVWVYEELRVGDDKPRGVRDQTIRRQGGGTRATIL